MSYLIERAICCGGARAILEFSVCETIAIKVVLAIIKIIEASVDLMPWRFIWFSCLSKHRHFCLLLCSVYHFTDELNDAEHQRGRTAFRVIDNRKSHNLYANEK